MEMAKKDWIWLIGSFGAILIAGGIILLITKKDKDNSGEMPKGGSGKAKGKTGSGSKTPAPAGATVKVEGTSDEWNPDYWKDKRASHGKIVILTSAYAKKMAAQIYDAKGVMNDDEDSVYAAIRTLKSKAQFSYVADLFKQNYKMDMKEYLEGFLSEDEEMPKVKQIIAGLPDFT